MEQQRDHQHEDRCSKQEQGRPSQRRRRAPPPVAHDVVAAGATTLGGQDPAQERAKRLLFVVQFDEPATNIVGSRQTPDDFVRFVQKPVLAGSAIHRGTLAAHRGPTAREMNRTILFEPEEDGGESVSVSDSLKHAVYPLVKGAHATTAPNFFSIGRVDTNDFIMPDYAISRQHAVFEIKRDDYVLRDCGSTNGTFLNGTRLEKKSLHLADKDVVSFARYEFAFLQPGSLYAMLIACVQTAG